MLKNEVAVESEPIVLDTNRTLNDSKLVNKTRKTPKNLHGLAFSLLCSLFSAFGHVLVKRSQITNGSEQTCVRYVIQGLIMALLVCLTKNSFLGAHDQRKFLVVRGFFGMVAMLCIHVSIKYITPSDAVALIHLNTVFVAVLARVTLKEKISLINVVCLMLSALGVWFIAQPSFLFTDFNIISTHTLNISTLGLVGDVTYLDFTLGVTMAITAAILSAIVAVVLKKLSDSKVHWSITTIYASYFGIPVTSLISLVLIHNDLAPRKPELYNSIPSLLEQITYSITSALCGTLSQVFVNVALKYEDASKVAIYRSTDLLFTYLFQYFLMNIRTNILSDLGACLIIVGTVLILIYKIIDKRLTKKRVKENSEPNMCTRVLFFKF